MLGGKTLDPSHFWQRCCVAQYVYNIVCHRPGLAPHRERVIYHFGRRATMVSNTHPLNGMVDDWY